MTPAEGRAMILTQHAELRALLAAAAGMARRHVRGTVVDRELDNLFDRIRVAFAEHNRLESALLTPLLRGVDAWGPWRIARMIEEHVQEHQLLEAFLARPAHELVPELADFIEELDAHMLAEERTFLSAHALPDR